MELSEFTPIRSAEAQTWTVVQFHDNSVEAVPTTWIQGDNCYWPTFSHTKIMSAIRKCEPLNTCWPMHKVKIFRNATFDDYMKARAKSKIAEETSDLTSDADNGLKRRRIQKIFTSSSSSEDSFTNEQSVLPPPPKISTYMKTSGKSNYQVESSHNKENVIVLENDEDNGIVYEVNPENTAKYNALNKTTVCNGLCICCTSHDKSIENLLTQIHILRAMVSDILLEIRANCGVGNRNTIQESSLFAKFPDLKFPISSEGDMEKFNTILQNDNNCTQAVNELAKIGGSNVYNFVKRVLTFLLSNDEAKKYSWLGRKGKRSFHKLEVARVIISAANKTALPKSEKETEVAIQLWLKRATERSSYKQTKKF